MRLSRPYIRTLTALFAVYLLFFALLGLVLPDRYVSSNENRNLQQLPAFSWERLFSGAYIEELERYLSDQFPLRDGFYALNNELSLLLGQRDFSGFYLGTDGSLLQMHDALDAKVFRQNLAYIQAFASAASSLSLPVRLLPVPGASYIYPEKLPYGGKEGDVDGLFDEASDGTFDLIDVRQALLDHKQEALYYRTDHHWTSLGAYRAWEAYLEQTGRQATPLSAYREELLSDSFQGTGASAVGLWGLPTDRIYAYDCGQSLQLELNLNGQLYDSLLFRDHLATRDQYAAFLNGNQPLVQIRGENRNGQHLLIVKDSYANCLAQFAIADFEQVDLIDLRSFNGDVLQYIEENGVTEVLVLYGVKNLCEDKNLYWLGRSAQAWSQNPS